MSPPPFLRQIYAAGESNKLHARAPFTPTILRPPSFYFQHHHHSRQAHLRSARGWRDPRGLLAYSLDSDYKDLYVYFDAADTKVLGMGHGGGGGGGYWWYWWIVGILCERVEGGP